MRPAEYSCVDFASDRRPGDGTGSEALDALRAFWRAYAEALAEYRAGNHDVVFPAGTYKMRVFFNVPCHPPPQPRGAPATRPALPGRLTPSPPSFPTASNTTRVQQAFSTNARLRLTASWWWTAAITTIRLRAPPPGG